MNNSRALILTFLLFLGLIALAVKLFDIQVAQHEYYAAIAKKQQEESIVIKAERGSIKDRSGEVLSYTQDDVSFFVDSRMLTNSSKQKVAKKFSEVFGKSEGYYLKLINSTNGNVFLEKKAPREKLNYFEDFVVDGFVWIDDPTRIYNYGSRAAHLIGYVNNELIGIDGIERVYDEYLTGTDGLLFAERDVQGRILTVKEDLTRYPVPGDDVFLTINTKYQKILEQELKKGVDNCGAKSGIGVLMNPNNGEIIALANYPSFNPSQYGSKNYDHEIRRNRALTDTYEPGSTMKAIVMAILLDQNLAKPDEIIDTENGRYRLANASIIDVHKYEKLTVKEVLEYSSNVGITKLSERIDDRTFYKYLRDFGFGNATSINLPSESSGYLKKPNDFSKLSKPFMSFGYEIAVTPLQMITAFSALINGGIIYQPRVIQRIQSHDGQVVEEFSSKKIRQVISTGTSKQMKDFLLGVIENGTGGNARLDNMFIGGKTGTAQKFKDGKYVKDYNASFIGYFPAEKPEIIGLILISSPATGKYGGIVAAPVYQAIAKRIIEEDINVIPRQDKIARNEESVNKILEYLAQEEDPVMLRTSNIDGIFHDNLSLTEIENRTTMPNLMNKSIRDALAVLNELGVSYDVEGSGKVVSQSISPGTVISKSEVCILKCESNNNLQILGIY